MLRFNDLGHKSEAQDPMDRHLRVFLALGVPLQPSLLFFLNKVLIHIREVSFLVVDGLQANIFHEPDQAVHDPCHLAKLF